MTPEEHVSAAPLPSKRGSDRARRTAIEPFDGRQDP